MKTEIIRKIFHIMFFSTIFLMEYMTSRAIQGILCIVGVLYYLFEQSRLQNKITIPVLSYLSKAALRKSEKNVFAFAPLTLILGIVLAIELYDNHQAIRVAITAVTVGDSVSALVGQTVPITPLLWNKKKSMGGVLANIVVVTLISMLWVTPWTAIALGIVSGIVESLNLEHIDNLVVPLAVGAAWYFL